jgi:Zn-finger nucleic acid-binding protein
MTDAPGDAHESPALGQCPRCVRPLQPPVGTLEEEVCGGCGGRYLPSRGVARLLEDERGLDLGLLRELSEHFGNENLRCPGCAHGCSTIQLKGERVDLCFGCGGLWLDAGELADLGEGRHVEPVALSGAAAEARAANLRAARDKADAIRRAREEEEAKERAAARRLRAVKRIVAGLVGALGVCACLFFAANSERSRSLRCAHQAEGILCDVEVRYTFETDAWREGPFQGLRGRLTERSDEGVRWYGVTLESGGFDFQMGEWRELERAKAARRRLASFSAGELRSLNLGHTSNELWIWLAVAVAALVGTVVTVLRIR